MIKKSDFPKEVFVRFEEDGKEKFLISEWKIQDAANLDETRLIGIYKLAEVVKLMPAVSEVKKLK